MAEYWSQTPSGSGADSVPWPDEWTYNSTQQDLLDEPTVFTDTQEMNHDDEYTAMNTSSTFGSYELARGEPMNHKVPPA